MTLRAQRRDRAARIGGDKFLLERAFADCLERVAMFGRDFGPALIVGCSDSSWPTRLAAYATSVAVVDPGPVFAAAAGGAVVIEDRIKPGTAAFDLVFAVGTLDTVDNLPQALNALSVSLSPGGLLIGAMSGGDTLPRLRSAMRAADRVTGTAAPHVHPRIEPAALARLLGDAGLLQPVVDVDRVRVSYSSLSQLVGDLRASASTNILCERPRQPLPRTAYAAAHADFEDAGDDGKTIETFEILNFAALRRGGAGTSERRR